MPAPHRRETGKRVALPARPNLLAGEDCPPQPRQRRSSANRERLKTEALRLFGEKGYEGTSIEEIAHRANLAIGGFYLHFRSKRQLLLTLMDDLLQVLSQLDLRVEASTDVRTALRALLSRAFSSDLRYLGAYRAWQEAALTDRDLTRKQRAIHAWTTARVTAVLAELQKSPGARPGVDLSGLARVMDTLFWALLGQALQLTKVDLDQWLDSSTHVLYHALFLDAGKKGGKS